MASENVGIDFGVNIMQNSIHKENIFNLKTTFLIGNKYYFK
jgi:hypothetical protein